MSDAVDRGITVTEIAAMDQPIDATLETTAAFVGRALRGPLNTPVLVQNYGEFRRRFGDVWSRSSLAPAAKMFFEHGGAQLYIVRVANNARGAMICLPASGSALVLRATEPGSTERIRAAVDYDGIDDSDDEHFNLTVQRVDPASGLVADQEIFERASFNSESNRFVGQLLLSSSLVRIEQPYPTHRPEVTISGAQSWSTYVGHAQEGGDGSDLSDYDLIGSRKNASGLFALEQIEHFDVLYLPQPAKGVATGPAAILAAEIYCRSRGAMLIVDPAEEWCSTDEAIRGIRQRDYRSPNMIAYFPRLRLRSQDDAPGLAAGSAIAALLCKLDRSHGAWTDLDREGLGLNRLLRPDFEIDHDDQQALIRAGLNVIVRSAPAAARIRGGTTMGRGSESHRRFASLPVRRTCLKILNAIDRSTRWAVFEQPDAELARHVRSQIMDYLHVLEERGALDNGHFLVQCDAGLCRRADAIEHGISILLVFHPVGSDEPLSFTLHQTVAGFRVSSSAFATGITARNDCA